MLAGTIFAVWGTLLAPGYGAYYMLAHWRPALAVLVVAPVVGGCASAPPALPSYQASALKQAAVTHFKSWWARHKREQGHKLTAHIKHVGEPEPGEVEGTWRVGIGARIRYTMRTYGTWYVVMRLDGTLVEEPWAGVVDV